MTNKLLTKLSKYQRRDRYYIKSISYHDRIKKSKLPNRFLHEVKEIFDNEFVNSFNRMNSFYADDLSDIKRSFNIKKVVGVLFSGGVDSTELVLDNIKRGNYVVPILNLFNIDSYSERLKYALACYSLEKIKEKYPENISEPVGCIKIQFCSLNDFSYTQQSFNTFSLFTLNKILKYIDEIQIGTVMEDQGVSYINDMKNSYKAGLRFIPDFDSQYDVRNFSFPKLTFPIYKYQKGYVRSRLHNLISEMKLDIPIISCENPQLFHSIVIKDKWPYIKTIILPCIDEKTKLFDPIQSSTKCNSCMHDEYNDFGRYFIYTKIDNSSMYELIKFVEEKYNEDKMISICKQQKEFGDHYDKILKNDILLLKALRNIFYKNMDGSKSVITRKK